MRLGATDVRVCQGAVCSVSLCTSGKCTIMKQQRDKLQSELEEFRQHWFASLAHVRPPVECSSEPSIPVTVDCKTCSYTASCSYRKHSCEARPRGGDEMKSREVVKVDIEEVRASSEANKLEQDSKCKQSGGRNSQFKGSHHMTTHTKMSLNNTHKRKIFCQRSMTKRHRRESIEENLVDQLISDIVCLHTYAVCCNSDVGEMLYRMKSPMCPFLT